MERVLYRSDAAESVSTQDVLDIIAASERNNPKREITGFLIYDSDRFLQLLEGPPLEVEALLGEIAGDDRNVGMEILLSETAEKRWFPDWSMKRLISFGSIPAQEELRAVLGDGNGGQAILDEVNRFLDS
ncbi:MAG: BLUF domain-containing protein [Erythrobacter sp.]|nr:BLUF domain-containing protein [Erythrobacter sp.]